MQDQLNLGLILSKLREKRPLTQCITNYVAMNICANVLLAAGASPAMVHSSREAGEFAAIASALTVNIGTLSPDWVEGMVAAINSANEHNKPWVFDPVAHFATSYRREIALKLSALSPTVIRGNASEIIALAGETSQGSGADSGDEIAAALDSARKLALHYRCIVAVTGERDFVTDGTRGAMIDGGSEIMPRVTALGCALTGLIGSFLAVHDEPFEATIAALMLFSIAGIEAEKNAKGPGSFEREFLDQLSLITPQQLTKAAKVELI